MFKKVLTLKKTHKEKEAEIREHYYMRYCLGKKVKEKNLTYQIHLGWRRQREGGSDVRTRL